MNTYRVDVQTPMGPRQHTIKGKSATAVRERIKKRVYGKVSVDIEDIHLLERSAKETVPRNDKRAAIIEALRNHPASSAYRLAELAGCATRDTVNSFLEKMESHGLATQGTKTHGGRKIAIWTLVEHEKRTA